MWKCARTLNTNLLAIYGTFPSHSFSWHSVNNSIHALSHDPSQLNDRKTNAKKKKIPLYRIWLFHFDWFKFWVIKIFCKTKTREKFTSFEYKYVNCCWLLRTLIHIYICSAFSVWGRLGVVGGGHEIGSYTGLRSCFHRNEHVQNATKRINHTLASKPHAFHAAHQMRSFPHFIIIWITYFPC